MVVIIQCNLHCIKYLLFLERGYGLLLVGWGYVARLDLCHSMLYGTLDHKNIDLSNNDFNNCNMLQSSLVSSQN